MMKVNFLHFVSVMTIVQLFQNYLFIMKGRYIRNFLDDSQKKFAIPKLDFYLFFIIYIGIIYLYFVFKKKYDKLFLRFQYE